MKIPKIIWLRNSHQRLLCELVFDSPQDATDVTTKGNSVFFVMEEPKPTTCSKMLTNIKLNHIVNFIALILMSIAFNEFYKFLVLCVVWVSVFNKV